MEFAAAAAPDDLMSPPAPVAETRGLTRGGARP